MVEGDPPPFYAWIVLVCLTCLSGMFSGLNLGLMSLTVEDLNIVINSSEDKDEISNAKKILPLRKHGNLLLCTLLIGNTLVNVMLAVVTDPIWVYLFGTGTPGMIMGLALPSLLIVVCGEIVPQSVCSRYALYIGAKTIPVTYIFVVVTFFMAYPISKILDRLLGDEIGGVYTRKGLLQLIKLNAEDPEHAKESGLNKEDEKILIGALTFQDRTIGQVMTTLKQVYSLPLDGALDKDTFLTIIQHGHSRIPVHDGDKTNIVGMLHVKCLLGVGFEREMPIKTVVDEFHKSDPTAFRVRKFPKDTKCDIALGACKTECVHMFIVTEAAAKAPDGSPDPLNGIGPGIGIVTIEDFIEEILQDEIVDEMDEYRHNGAPPADADGQPGLQTQDADGQPTLQTQGTRNSGSSGRTASRLQRLNTNHVDAAVVLRSLCEEGPGQDRVRADSALASL